jgi:hypothetical protein
LRDRFAREDIEIFCTRTIRVQIAFCHPDEVDETVTDDDGGVAYGSILATMHPIDESTGDSAGLWSYAAGTGTGEGLVEISGDLGVGPDEKVWEVGPMDSC